MKTTVREIKKILDEQRSNLISTYFIKELGVFGSVARGEYTNTSDIDLLVKFTKPISMFKFIELENHLSQLFRMKVDMVTDKALKPAIKSDVLKEVIYV